jgi:hypothetical protein
MCGRIVGTVNSILALRQITMLSEQMHGLALSRAVLRQDVFLHRCWGLVVLLQPAQCSNSLIRPGRDRRAILNLQAPRRLISLTTGSLSMMLRTAATRSGSPTDPMLVPGLFPVGSSDGVRIRQILGQVDQAGSTRVSSDLLRVSFVLLHRPRHIPIRPVRGR